MNFADFLNEYGPILMFILTQAIILATFIIFLIQYHRQYRILPVNEAKAMPTPAILAVNIIFQSMLGLLTIKKMSGY